MEGAPVFTVSNEELGLNVESNSYVGAWKDAASAAKLPALRSVALMFGFTDEVKIKLQSENFAPRVISTEPKSSVAKKQKITPLSLSDLEKLKEEKFSNFTRAVENNSADLAALTTEYVGDVLDLETRYLSRSSTLTGSPFAKQ